MASLFEMEKNKAPMSVIQIWAEPSIRKNNRVENIFKAYSNAREGGLLFFLIPFSFRPFVYFAIEN